LLKKGTTGGEYFTTVTGRTPEFIRRAEVMGDRNISNSPNVYSTFMAANRTFCEATCLDESSCYGFVSLATALELGDGDATGNYTTDCYFLSYPCVGEPGTPEPCEENVTYSPLGYFDNVNWPSGMTTVLKAGGEPCTLVVDSDEMTKQVTYCAATQECYLTADNSTRMRFDTNVNGCDGWLLESYSGPTEKVVLDNCTDKAALAKMFMEDYLGETGDYDYPCQTGFDMMLCKNPVFFGLCPHTCAPFESVTVAGASFTYQLTDLDYEKVFTAWESADNTNNTNRSCIGDNDVAAYYFMRNHTTGHSDAIAETGGSVRTPRVVQRNV
jgi:hypothetical protein